MERMRHAGRLSLNRDNTTPSFRVFMALNGCVLVILAAVTIAPFWYVVVNSLRSEKSIITNGYLFWPDHVSLANYGYLLSAGSRLIRGFLVTASITVLGTSLALVVGTMFAYAVSRKGVPFARGMLLFGFIGTWIPSGIIGWYLQMRNLGLNGSFLVMVLPDIIVIFNILLLKTHFQEGGTIALEESARLDGANDFQVLLNIVVPASRPILATVGLFYAVSFWNSWYSAAMFISDPDLYPLQLILNQLITSQAYQSALARLNVDTGRVSAEGLKMASIVLITLPLLVAYPFVQGYFVKGVMVGAIKE
jgi:putative aldouronate transport system permease protein